MAGGNVVCKEATLLVVSHKVHRGSRSSGAIEVQGGFEAVNTELARHFRCMRLCVPVVWDETIKKHAYVGTNIELVSLPHPPTLLRAPIKLGRTFKCLMAEIRSADIVYAMGPTGNVSIWTLTIAKVLNRPIIYGIDADRVELQKARGLWARALISRWLIYPYIQLLARRDLVVFTGNVFWRGFKRSTQWIRTTITTESLPPPPKDESLTAPCSDREKSIWKVAFVGRLSQEKGIDILINAVKLLHNQGYGIKIIIIGDGPLRCRLEEVRNECLDGLLEILGYQDHTSLLRSRFLKADALVLPSRSERQGKVLLEAMACGVPVIASRVGGIPSVIAHGVNGLLFDPEDAFALADQLKELMGNIGLRRRLIAEGYEFAKEHTLDNEIKRIVGSIEEQYNPPGPTLSS